MGAPFFVCLETPSDLRFIMSKAFFTTILGFCVLFAQGCKQQSSGGGEVKSEDAVPTVASPVTLSRASTRAENVAVEGQNPVIPVKQRELNSLDNAADDAWDTEVLAQQASEQLGRLAKLLEETTSIDLGSLATGSVEFHELLPANVTTVYRNGPVTVGRIPKSVASSNSGRSALETSVEQWRSKIAPYPERHAKFKVFRVKDLGDKFETEQYVTVTARSDEGSFEQHATWRTTWKKDRVAPLLDGIQILAFEQTSNDSPRWFADCTKSVFGNDQSFRDQLSVGYGDWLKRIPHGIYLEAVGTPESRLAMSTETGWMTYIYAKSEVCLIDSICISRTAQCSMPRKLGGRIFSSHRGRCY